MRGEETVFTSELLSLYLEEDRALGRRPALPSIRHCYFEDVLAPVAAVRVCPRAPPPHRLPKSTPTGVSFLSSSHLNRSSSSCP